MHEGYVLFDFKLINDLYQSELSKVLLLGLQICLLVLDIVMNAFSIVEAFLIKVLFGRVLDQQNLLVPFSLVFNIVRVGLF